MAIKKTKTTSRKAAKTTKAVKTAKPIDRSEEVLNAVNTKISKVRTRSLDISFNEILDMYSDGEFVITPEYQRLFRWSEGKQSRFIETLILEMPIPPLYAIETESGKYELIDGLQRISSYLHFRGVLERKGTTEEENIKMGSVLTLQECDIVPELNNLTYEQLPGSLKIRLKRSFVRVEILRKESEQKLKYYMFKRLNTGGEELSDQEIRNCTIRLADPKFYDFTAKMSEYPAFKKTTSSLSDDKIPQKYDHELVLRFFAFKNWYEKYKKDVGDFITEYMEAVSGLSETREGFDYKVEEVTFKKTFDALYTILGADAFSKMNAKGTFVSVFIVYQYEAFILGIQSYLGKIDLSNRTQLKELKKLFNDLKADKSFNNLVTGGGKNTRAKMKLRVGRVEDCLKQYFK